MKMNEEPNAHKEEVKTENNQRRMLKDEELEAVTGGSLVPRDVLDLETAVGETPVASALRPR